MKFDLTFIKSVFSDGDQGSFSRCSAGFIIVITCVWVSHVVFKTHSLPDLTGPLAFLSGGTACTYGCNKMPAIVDSIKGNNNG